MSSMNKGLIFAGGMVLGGAIGGIAGVGVGAVALLRAALNSDNVSEALEKGIAADILDYLGERPSSKSKVTYKPYYARRSYKGIDSYEATRTCSQYWFPSKKAAYEAIAHLNELITTYGYANCADLFEWVGLDASDVGFWTTQYGWSVPLKDTYVTYNSHCDAYQINFPRCRRLEIPKEEDDIE